MFSLKKRRQKYDSNIQILGREDGVGLLSRAPKGGTKDP